jgi:hypothetical protein
MNHTVPEILRDCAATYEQRNRLYGDNYKKFGDVMKAIYPQGIALYGVDEFNRFGIFVQCISKLTRYAESLTKGGHKDSAHDLSVYAAMLEELTDDNPAGL